MNSQFLKTLIILLIVNFTINNKVFCQVMEEKQNMQQEKAEKWFRSNVWRNGFKLEIAETINVAEFETQYRKNRLYWDKAFAFIRDADPDTVAPGRYEIDGTNVYFVASEAPTRNIGETRWEAHKKYVDIQYVTKGKEKMGIGPLLAASATGDYDQLKDVCFFSIDDRNCKYFVAHRGIIVIFFPDEVHRPGIRTEGSDSSRKIVVKIRYD